MIRHSHRQAFRSVLFLLINTCLFNAFQKHLADSKLSTNTYLMSVVVVFQKLQVKVDVTQLLLKQSYTIQHSSQFDFVYVWISKFNSTITTIYSFYKYTCNGLRSNIGITPLRVAVPKHSPPDSTDNIDAKIAGFARVLSTSFYTVSTGPIVSKRGHRGQFL